MTKAEKTSILVVDDEIIVAEDIRLRLTKLGYDVVGTAATGQGAIKGAGDKRPDLVLMDINLKGEMDGIEAARQIRRCYDISVIYLTAFSDDMTLARAKITMPYAYILKPFTERELHSNIEMAIYRHRAEKEIKTLRGLLPICATCKQIRDDKGYWNQIETYIKDRTEAEFTHGICPTCAEKVLKELKEQ